MDNSVDILWKDGYTVYMDKGRDPRLWISLWISLWKDCCNLDLDFSRIRVP